MSVKARKLRRYFAMVALLLLLVAYIGWAFYFTPRRLFRIGMTLEEVRAAIGDGLKVYPAALSYPEAPTERQKSHDEIYWVPVRRMGVDLHLNHHKRVVRIEFVFGSDLRLEQVKSEMDPSGHTETSGTEAG